MAVSDEREAAEQGQFELQVDKVYHGEAAAPLSGGVLLVPALQPATAEAVGDGGQVDAAPGPTALSVLPGSRPAAAGTAAAACRHRSTGSVSGSGCQCQGVSVRLSVSGQHQLVRVRPATVCQLVVESLKCAGGKDHFAFQVRSGQVRLSASGQTCCQYRVGHSRDRSGVIKRVRCCKISVISDASAERRHNHRDTMPRQADRVPGREGLADTTTRSNNCPPVGMWPY